MTDRARERWVLITGAGRRLGAAIASDFASNGWNLILHAFASVERAQALAEQLRDRHGVRAEIVIQDLGKLAELEEFTMACKAIAPEVHLLVNNASLFPYDDVDTVSPDMLEECYRINCAAPVMLSRHYAQILCPTGDEGGAIVNIIDTKISKPNGRYLSYELSKCALAAATSGLARALSPRIRVNGVGPGLTLRSGKQSKQDFERIHARTPLERGVAPEDICAAVAYLATAHAVTGQIIAVDAGQGLPEDDGEFFDSMS